MNHEETALNAEQPDINSSVSKSQQDPFVVVGLGASAGGLQALEAFFSALPKTDGAAFVVVIHLDPSRESEMAEILGRSVPLPVTQVTEAVEVERGHVYVIPPNRNLAMEDGQLRLEPLEDERRRRRPIDHFFRTLGEAYAEHAVGVVLSGTGQNGTVGVRRIKECGGLVLAQDPDEAAFDEMPRSAITSGQVDQVATAARLGHEVIAYAEHLHRVRLPESHPDSLPVDDVQTVRRILGQLRTRTGHDFALYKRPTVLRQLARRLHVAGLSSLTDYYDYLRRHAGEAEKLLKDLLISVTNFFRDPDTFEALEKEVIPRLFEGKSAGGNIRVWVAGCATGEEAYSLAMLLAEHAAGLTEPSAFQVFATDLSEHAIQTARAGVYPESIEADVTPERLQAWFRKTGAGYRVREDLRERVLFAPHNLLKDPPFAHVDLVACRNLLIYLQPSLQRRVLELFHYALRPGGTLFLGSSETADAAKDLFTLVDKKARLYRSRETEAVLSRVPPVTRLRGVPVPPPVEDDAPGPMPVAALHEQLRAAMAPPSVLVDEAHNVVHLSDAVAPFLQMGGGEPTQNVLRLVRPALRPAVQAALFQVRRNGGTVTSGPVHVEIDGAEASVRLRVVAAEASGYTQLVFEAEPLAPEAPSTAHSPDTRAAVLQQEVAETHEQLQLTIEEFETSREELLAQNEELQSINEELRSTAEELETSKEEAQSMAEELQAVNDELKGKVDELARAKGDLENLIAATEIATLFLDKKLHIQWFTPHVRHHFHVRASDTGRPLADFAQKFGSVRLVEDAQTVLERLEVREREVEVEGGAWHLVQVRPYRSVEDRIVGVVVTFMDITERKKQEAALEQGAARFRALVEASAQIIWTADARGKVVEDSPSWRAFTGQSFDEWKGDGWAQAIHPADRAAVVDKWQRAVAGAQGFETEFRLRHAPSQRWRWMRARAVPLFTSEGDVRGWVGMNEDVTDTREAADALRQSEEQYRLLVESTTEYAMMTLDPGGNIVSWSKGAEHIFGYAEEDVLGQPGALIFTPEDRAAGAPEAEVTQAAETGCADDDRWHLRKNGSRFWASGVMTALREADGTLRGFAKVLRDNTERKQVEDALRASEERLRQALTVARMGTWAYDVGRNIIRLDERAREVFGFDKECASPEEVAANVHPDDAGAFEAASAAALAPGGSGTLSETHRVVDPDGTVRWVLGQTEVFFEGEGDARRPTRAVGVVLDVTEEREAEAMLRASEARFRAMAETVPDVLFTATADGVVDYVSQQMEDLTGTAPEALLGTRMWPALLHPGDAARAEQAWAEAVERCEAYELRYRLRTCDGTYCWVIVRARPFLDADGALVQWFGSITDVDALTGAEQALQALNDELETRVEERTAQVLHLARRLATAEQQERQRIAQVLHDDLQQQLYGMSVMLELLGSVGDAAKKEKLTGQVTTTLDQAIHLTRTLATELSPPVMESERLDDLLHWLALREEEQRNLHVHVEMRGACTLPDHGLRVLLYQILRELLLNVTKYAGVGAAHLEAWQQGGSVHILVRDDGDGFDPQALRAAQVTGGFGFNSIRERLRMVGGHIEIDSAPGEGTRVRVSLPVELPEGA